MKSSNKTIALVISGALALSVGVANVQAASNPFAIKSLSSGYQVADATADTGTKMKDGKCGTGKCGANKKKAMEKAEAEKGKEGSCSAEKAAEGKCSADMKKDAMENKATDKK